MNIIAIIIGYFVITCVSLFITVRLVHFLWRLYEVNFIMGPSWQMEAERRAEHKHIVEVIERIQNATSN